ncbi:hypothetical protein NC239_33710 [Streptomyces sp. G3]|uniref:hypothetical protein n=1 Tax=Streptomyces sp. G3 TaxID=690144 RepID=UPI0020306ABE|nr:hypothetical protein [Streptomyces sp. G3]MCM1943171.1 hypothetical protein [Streptomyces sp. G3]
MTDQTTETARALLPPSQGPEYTPCACTHIEPEHEPNRGECYSCDCTAYRPTPPVPLPSADQSPIREQLLNAIDFSFCQSLGYGTPEGLLAAYEASRTQTVDPAALREIAAQAIRDAACTGDCGQTEEECAKERIQPFAWHHGTLAVVEGSPEQFVDAVLAAVLPATTNHDTDTAPAATCSAQYHGPGEDRARLCIRAAQHQRTAHTDEHGFHWSDTVAMYPVADGTFRIGTDVRAELRRVADETAATKCSCGALRTGPGRHLPECPNRAAAGARQDGAQA